MNTFEIIVQKIIREQEQLIGPVAWREAANVKGLRIINQETGEIAIEPNVDGREVIDGLVLRFGNLFGKVVTDFMPSGTVQDKPDLPRRKFTLRITDAIENFLHYKTHNTKLSKADYLRGQIEKLMEDDKGWQDYQRRRQQ